MKTFMHGLVIGKFYPPHAGHEYLIRTAADHCHSVTVVVMAASHETIPLTIRVSSLKEVFAGFPHVAIVGVMDDVPVDYHDPAIWEQHVALMREGVVKADQGRASVPVDAVFTSESYGDELARYFEAVPVCLDQARELYPVSGTAVRQAPAYYWDQLDASIRAWMALRVVIVGAESTGKTTLAQRLAASLQARGGSWERVRWVPEFGREHTQNKLALARGRARLEGQSEPGMHDLLWSSAEFEFIARRQWHMEDTAARYGGPVLVADTDAFATGIWHERYVGRRSAMVESLRAAPCPRRLYLLTDVNSVPFEQDGIRDGESIRGWMQDIFHQRLGEQGYAWRLITGDRDDFLRQALQCVEDAQQEAWRFAPPLG